jgi:hypothetical protein
MNKLIRVFLLGLLVGIVTGWLMAEQKQAREAQADREAYQNDPELVAVRKEIALERQLMEVMDNLEDRDD